MRRHRLAWHTVCALLILVACSAVARAATFSFTPIGPVTDSYFRTNAVSSDGSVVAGSQYGGPAPSGEAFRWTSGTGIGLLGDLPGGPGPFQSLGLGVSGDGSIVVGGAWPNYYGEAFRWTSGTGMVGLGLLPTGTGSQAKTISADGLVIAGSANTSSGAEAFRWTAGDGMVGLGRLGGPGDYASATALSADGSVMAGYSSSPSSGSFFEAFRWTDAGGMVGLGDLAGGGFYSEAHGVSADGSVIVGFGTAADGREAFRWTDGGGMVGLGDLAGLPYIFSEALGVSGDGSIVVGRAASIDYYDEEEGEAEAEAFLWTQDDGMLSLRSLLVANGITGLDDVRLTTANAISSDGMTIVGDAYNSATGQAFGYVATLGVVPEPSTWILATSGLGILALARWRRRLRKTKPV